MALLNSGCRCICCRPFIFMLTASISNATDYEALSCCCTTNCPSGWLAVCKLSCNPRPTARCGAHTVQLAGPDNANPCWLKFTASRTSCKTPTEQSTAAGTNGTAQFQNWLSVTFEGFRLVFTAISDIVTDQQSYARQAVHDKCRQAGRQAVNIQVSANSTGSTCQVLGW